MPENVDLDAYICGGYFLSKRISRPSALSKLVPDWITTVSECFTDIAPNTWADRDYNYGDEERAAEAFKFGILADTSLPYSRPRCSSTCGFSVCIEVSGSHVPL